MREKKYFNRLYVKAKKKQYYDKNKEKIVNKSKEYYKDNAERIKRRIKLYNINNREKIYEQGVNARQKDKRKEKIKQYKIKWEKTKRKEYYQKNKEKINSQHKAQKYIKFPPNQLCESCNKKEAMHRHHPNYNKPLDIIFLCSKCHMRLHKGGDDLLLQNFMGG